MNKRTAWVSLLVVVCLGLQFSTGSKAAVTPDQKKQIADVSKELGKVQSLITKKDFDDADKLLKECEQKLKQTAKDAGIAENDKLVAVHLKKVEQLRETLTKKRPAAAAGGGAAVTFERDVAPILAARCLNCHGANNPKGRLRMDTFGGIVAGGAGGPLLVPNKPGESALVLRISADGDERMPRNAPALSADDIKKISDWIAAGAKFTGKNDTPIADLKGTGGTGAAKPDTTPVQINKATGKETVSFASDIAPFMSNLCVNCHSGNNPRSGFSLETFEKLMQGGKSGRVVLPGNSKDSRLWHLVGEQEPIKMPPGQAQITYTNRDKLKIWIDEGAKFDGLDPKATLRSLVPTDAEKLAKELAALSPDELALRRKARARDLWKAALSNDTPTEHETEGFIVLGNVSEARVKQIADWSGADAEILRKLFKIKESAIWRGKLTVFVFKDKYSYLEFGQVNERVEIPAETKGHSKVSALGNEAYICLLDIGDSATEDSPGVRVQLMGLLAEASLQRVSNRVPDWAAKGTGLVLAARTDAKNPYFRGLNAGAHDALRALDKPEELFANGTFSPADLAPVGYTLVSFMLKQGEPHFVDFLSETAAGKSLNDALKSIYNVDPVSLARAYAAYVDGLPGAKAAGKKKK